LCDKICQPNNDPPSDPSDPCIISETYGVFVSPLGLDSNPGTQTQPVATVGHAMDLAALAHKAVYACGNAGSYLLENLSVTTARDGVAVYGGFDCLTTAAAWKYDASDVATMAPAASGYALQVSGLTTGVTFTDFAFTAQPSIGAGESSIAVFVSNSSNVAFTRVKMTAQDAAGGTGATGAAGGTPGTDPSNWTAMSLNGTTGSTSTGGLLVTCNCGDSSASVGASAGNSTHSPGNGSPALGGGVAGTNSEACNVGGASGADGDNGPASAVDTGSTSLGVVFASGWTPASGVKGSNGQVAQGGGGGGDGTGGTGAGGGGA